MDDGRGNSGRFALRAGTAGSRNNWLYGVALVLVTAVFRLVFLAGPIGSDDTRYMDAAWKLAHGQPAGVLDHAYVRAAWVLWLAGWTRLGMGGTALVISQVLVSIGLVLALYWLGLKLTGDSRAAMLGALCWALFPVELSYAGMVLPDQLGVLLALLGVGLSLEALRAAEGETKWLRLIGAGILCGLAVSVKEPYALVPVILGLWVLLEIRPLRAGLERVAIIGAVAVGTFALEYPFFRLWTGDWLYRHHVLQVVYGPDGRAMAGERFTFGTLIYYPRDVLFNPAVCGLFGWLLLIAAIYALRRVREAKFIVVWSIAFFVFLQYGSTTLSRYQPLPMQPRYVHPMIILLFIPLGRWLADVADSAPFGRIGCALLLAAVSLQGMIAVEADAAQGLYSANLPRAVERTLAMQGNEPPCRVALPEVVNAHIPPDLRKRTDCWPKIELSGSFSAVDFAQLRERHIALLIPNDLVRVSSPVGRYPVLVSWLDQHARRVPVEDGETFLDRFYLATGIKILQRRATSVVIARLYFFDD
jgi:hypothetical protein